MKYILILLLLHWFADFVLQTKWQARNKSFNSAALLSHVFTYSFILAIGLTPFVLDIWKVLAIAGLNGGLHGIIDAVTSRLSAKLYNKEDLHDFFVIIGFDQFLHVAILISSFYYILML